MKYIVNKLLLCAHEQPEAGFRRFTKNYIIIILLSWLL